MRCSGPSASSAPRATSRKAAQLSIIATALIDTGSRMDE
jgi:transcription termination factor Rho